MYRVEKTRARSAKNEAEKLAPARTAGEKKGLELRGNRRAAISSWRERFLTERRKGGACKRPLAQDQEES